MHWLFEWCNQSQSLCTGMITLVFYSSSLLSECDEVLSFVLVNLAKCLGLCFSKALWAKLLQQSTYAYDALGKQSPGHISPQNKNICNLFSNSILHKENEACFRISYIVTFIFLSICIYCTFNSPDSHFQWWFWFLYLNQHKGSKTNTIIIYKYLIYHYFQTNFSCQ